MTANDKDITAALAERFVRMSLTDETGFNSDTFEVTLSDTDESNPVKIPPTGAELQVWLGYNDVLTPKGLFVCDEIELTDAPSTMIIRAHAAPYEGTPKGKRDFQTQKTRSWPANTTIGAMVSKMAGEHGMTPATSPELANVQLPHIDQSAESDINLLVRLAKRYDAIAKPAGGKLIFAKRGNARTVSGADLPNITVTRKQVVPGTLRLTIARRDSAGTVVAFYRDNRAAARHQVSVGSGDPVKRLRTGFKNAAMATAAVEAELAKRARGELRLSFSMAGQPNMTAETNLTMDGTFRDGIEGDWLVTRVRHSEGPDGFRTDVEAEKHQSAHGWHTVDQIETALNKGHRVAPPGLHPLWRDHPQSVVSVELEAKEPCRFVRAGAGQNSEFEASGGDTVAGLQGSDERWNISVGHCRVVFDLLHLRRLGQDHIQMTAPTGRVFTLEMPVNLCIVNNRFNSTANTGGRFVLLFP
ncbi:contractile injection system protein, VgrG/Pvc8 family [Dyella sp.]|uniref:contractile injection system protein, VgrG/Pvc8 family n=1 Tax=Dyella sp. TaxID=1869338 RepID=UPI00284D6667|nr:contractile injection system protein, VgrG/Pvc8 family [Dyella sp.]MDR3445748.1 contractile injection system protein, VgrG/Pvc8 family [Dyella sp.]